MRVSVVIPSYNAEGFLDEALRSVLEQTRAADEIVVVDDASSDRTVEVAQSFSPRVRVVVNSTNAGPGVRRNQGAQDTSGDVLAFLDADDFWDPEHLEITAGLLDRWPEAGVAFSPVRYAGVRQGRWPESLPDLEVPRLTLLDLLRNNFVHPSASVVRRAAFDEVGGFQELARFHHGRRVQAEDYDLFLRIARRWPFVCSPVPTAHYRWHESQSSTSLPAQVTMAFEYRLRLLNTLRSEEADPKLLAQAEDRIRLCWGEHAEKMWTSRDIEGLRQMVRYGLGQSLLGDVTQPYRMKAGLPAWAIRLRDQLAARS